MPSASQDSSPPSAPLADEALMLQLAEGDEAALRELIRRWQTALLNFFYRSVNDHALAEELTQTVFIRLYRAAPRYRATAKFSTYLFHIARRLLINAVQKAARRPATPTAPEELHAIDGSATDRRLAELEEIFRVALPNLPENQRTAILLLKQQQLSYAEIATIMRASESAVKTWIFRARQTLKQSLDAEV
ncbi:MAG: RNA polymerase sigma factor [Opitutales bacterium]